MSGLLGMNGRNQKGEKFMSTLDEKLIETIVKHQIEELPRTRSGKGYIFLDPLDPEKKAIPPKQFAIATVRLLQEKNLLETGTERMGYSRTILATAAIQECLKRKIHIVGQFWKHDANKDYNDTLYVLNDAEKEYFAAAVAASIAFIQQLSVGIIHFLDNVSPYFAK